MRDKTSQQSLIGQCLRILPFHLLIYYFSQFTLVITHSGVSSLLQVVSSLHSVRQSAEK